jgi:molecular chaperone GrpE
MDAKSAIFWEECYPKSVSDSVVKDGPLNEETPESGAPATPDVAALEAEKAELQDRLLRTQAEFQNLRRRQEKEKLEFSEYASMEAVRALLPILDDFERALKSNNNDDEYVKGMQLIHQRFGAALEKLGLEPMNATGQPFDPHAHHAVEMVETDEAEDQTVLGEFQRGYNFKGRLLRPAMVKVAVAPKN